MSTKCARCRVAALAIFGILLFAQNAGAQVGKGFMLQRFRPATSPLNFLQTERGAVLPHLSPSVNLIFNYAHNPLLLEGPGGKTNSRLVRYQIAADLMVALGLFDRFELGLALPVNLAQSSDGFSIPGASTSLGAAGLGDLRIVPKARIVTWRALSLGLSVPIYLPTGNEDKLLGDGGVGVAPTIIADLALHRRFGMALNLAYRVRPDNSFTYRTQGKLSIDDEVQLSLGARFGIWQDGEDRKIDLIADAWMALSTKELDKEEGGGEVLVGARFYLPYGFGAQVAAGPGLGQLLGTPSFRVIAGLSWYLPKMKNATVKDSDGDGILDPDDKCPTTPEDKDGYRDGDGCPDPDNDQDGILDTEDKCPLKPETKNGYQDRDGCPDKKPDIDSDHDGILDSKDKCPKQAEDKDGYQDQDGCPDPDNDGDGILDVEDKCPLQPEIFNGVRDKDGCPDKSRGTVQITHNTITVAPVYFATNRDRILRRSFATLRALAKTLKMNLWVKKVRIGGHTDSRGKAEANRLLSERRAESVKRFLIKRGISEDRLTTRGYGETKPIASNRSRRGRAKNRRVEFIIIDPAQ